MSISNNDRRSLIDGIRENSFGTLDVADWFGISKAKAWKILHELEMRGVLEGMARDRHGDDVERGTDGRPVRPAELWWMPPHADIRTVTLAEANAIADMIERMASPAKRGARKNRRPTR